MVFAKIYSLFKLLINLVRIVILKIFRNRITFGNNVSYSVKIYDSSIGSYNYFGPYIIINNTTIGNYCSIAAHTQIGGMEHGWKNASTSTWLNPDLQVIKPPTIIESDVWIGANVYVKQGVKIGRGAVIGAGSVVTKDVSPFSIAFGAPARHYNYRFSESKIELINKSKYWQLSPEEAKKVIASLELNEND